jgi:hypothetical protein
MTQQRAAIVNDYDNAPIIAHTGANGGIVLSAGKLAICLNSRELARLLDFANTNNAARLDGATVVTPAKRHAQLLRYEVKPREQGQNPLASPR